MSFNYTPKTEADIASMSLFPEGDYPFTVRDASDAPSKSSGKAMLTLHLLVYAPNGGTYEVTDRIVPGSNYGDKKLFELCKALGLLPQYQNQQLNKDLFLGKEGWAKIRIEKGKPKDPNDQSKGVFFDRNSVGWYLKGAPEKAASTTPARNQPTERELANLAPESAKDDGEMVPF